MKHPIASFLFVGTGVGAFAGVIGVGDRMQIWPLERSLGAIGGLALLGALVSLLLHLLWSAKNSPSTSEDIGAPDIGDYSLEMHSHHQSSADSGTDFHHD